MRILHVVPTYLPAMRYGGPIYSVHALCRALAARGHDVDVYTTNVDGPGVSAVPTLSPTLMDGVRVTYFPVGAGRRLYRSPAMDASLSNSMPGYDAVHLHSVFLWPTMMAARRARSCGVPYFISPRGMLVRDLIRRKSRLLKSAWISAFERRNLAEASAVHVTSALEETELRTLGLATRRIVMIPNGVDAPMAAGHDAAAGNRIGTDRRVVFIGRLNWKKGLDRLIAAMAHVPGAVLTIAGPDDENYGQELRTLAVLHGVADRVSFMGPVEGDDKWQLLKSSDVFALPSYSENFGIAVLEAMSCGIPVVVTPEVGLASSVAEASAGMVVAGEPEAIGSALTELLADPALRARLGENGRQSAVRQFSWASIAEQMEAAYFDATGQARAKTRVEQRVDA